MTSTATATATASQTPWLGLAGIVRYCRSVIDLADPEMIVGKERQTIDVATDDMRMRTGGARFWWLIALGAGVGTVLAVLFAYERLVLGPQGTPMRDLIKEYLFVAAIATVAAAISAVQAGRGRSLGRATAAVALGTSAGGVFAMWLAVITGNGPDEGDGFFWLSVASLIVSLVAAVAAMLTARRLRRSAT